MPLDSTVLPCFETGASCELTVGSLRFAARWPRGAVISDQRIGALVI
jgi:hypothetical protein